MAKPPLMGRVKTRLSREVGTVAAVQFYRASVQRLLTHLSSPSEWSLKLAVNASAQESYACWPKEVQRMGQGSGSLGSRMGYVLDSLPPGPVLIIGTDSPQIDRRDIRQAFKALSSHDAVFGPSDDGGYWMIGMARRRPAPHLFEGVAWSTETALDDTIRSLPASFRVAQQDVLTDVDTESDLNALRADWGHLRFGPWRSKAAVGA